MTRKLDVIGIGLIVLCFVFFVLSSRAHHDDRAPYEECRKLGGVLVASAAGPVPPQAYTLCVRTTILKRY